MNRDKFSVRVQSIAVKGNSCNSFAVNFEVGKLLGQYSSVMRLSSADFSFSYNLEFSIKHC